MVIECREDDAYILDDVPAKSYYASSHLLSELPRKVSFLFTENFD